MSKGGNLFTWNHVFFFFFLLRERSKMTDGSFKDLENDGQTEE